VISDVCIVVYYIVKMVVSCSERRGNSSDRMVCVVRCVLWILLGVWSEQASLCVECCGLVVV